MGTRSFVMTIPKEFTGLNFPCECVSAKEENYSDPWANIAKKKTASERHERTNNQPRRQTAANNLSTGKGIKNRAAERSRSRQRIAGKRTAARFERMGKTTSEGTLLRA